jgi:hypothetical protein
VVLLDRKCEVDTAGSDCGDAEVLEKPRFETTEVEERSRPASEINYVFEERWEMNPADEIECFWAWLGAVRMDETGIKITDKARYGHISRVTAVFETILKSNCK